MNIATKIRYLHYILCFIDDEFKICNTLDDTFCSASISGENDDFYMKKQGCSYQFSLCNDICYAQLLKTDDSILLEEKPWMKPYLRDQIQTIHQFNDENSNEFVIFSNIAGKKYKIFYVRAINIQIKLEFFEKIIHDPTCFVKGYTSKELFYILNSYFFTILDNQFFILKNILFLIVNNLFDIDEIHQISIDFISIKNENSPMLRKFHDSKIIDLQSKIEQFTTNNQYLQSDDKFLSNLHRWKCIITNMFMLIDQTFYFSIISDQNDEILRIYNNPNAKSSFDINVNEIGNLMSLISIDCIFYIEYFTSSVSDIIFSIFEEKQMKIIHIDTTNFFKKLLKYETFQIIEENEAFHQFIDSTTKRTNKSIQFDVGIHQIILEQNFVKNYIKIRNQRDENDVYFDEILFICKRILKMNHDELEYPLEVFSEAIMQNYQDQTLHKLENISIIYNGIDCNSLQHQRRFTYNFDNKQFFNMKLFDNQHSNQSDTIFIDENSGGPSQIVGMKNFSIKIESVNFLEGIIDDEFSFLILNRALTEKKFISQVKDFLAREILQDFRKTLQETKNIDLFHIKPDKQKLTFKIDSLLQNDSINHNQQSVVFSQAANNHMPTSNNAIQTNLFHDDESEIIKNEFIEIHHQNPLSIQYKVLQCSLYLNSHKSTLKCIKNSEFTFEVQKSNFHFIIMKFLELESMNNSSSSFKKIIEHSVTYIDVYFCYISFIPSSYFSLNDLYIYNCELRSTFYIDESIFTKQNHFFKIVDMLFTKLIILLNFMKISSKNSENAFALNKDGFKYVIQVQNCRIEFYDDIPCYISRIYLSYCEIVLNGNNINLSKKISSKTILKSDISSEIDLQILELFDHKTIISIEIDNCILPPNLRINGNFQFFQMKYCSTNLNLNYSSRMQIMNHRGQFSVDNFITTAIPLQPTNLLHKNENALRLENLEISELKNLRIEQIIVINCIIHSIKNIRCMYLKFSNTQCAFKMIKNKNERNLCSKALNLKISQTTYMNLDEHDICCHK